MSKEKIQVIRYNNDVQFKEVVDYLVSNGARCDDDLFNEFTRFDYAGIDEYGDVSLWYQHHISDNPDLFELSALPPKKVKVLECRNDEQYQFALRFLKSEGGILHSLKEHFIERTPYVGINGSGYIDTWTEEFVKKMPYHFEVILEVEKNYKKTYVVTEEQLRDIANGKGKEVLPEVFETAVDKVFDFEDADVHRKARLVSFLEKYIQIGVGSELIGTCTYDGHQLLEKICELILKETKNK